MLNILFKKNNLYCNNIKMSIETITEEYKNKNNLNELSEYDFKLINSIQKLREGYSNELSKRRCSIFLKEPIAVSVFDKKSNKIEKTIEEDTSICQAIQMNGNQCKAKAKDGKFCGRHCKK